MDKMSKMSSCSEAKKEIENVLKNINKSWTQGRPKELEKYFHNDIVIQGPGFQNGIKGKSDCVKHYEDFSIHTNIKNYKGSEYVVNIWDKTAVASYKFDVEFESDGKIRKESGHELYTFLKKANVWKAVWNTIVPSNGNG